LVAEGDDRVHGIVVQGVDDELSQGRAERAMAPSAIQEKQTA
jgi:hypothetical protein